MVEVIRREAVYLWYYFSVQFEQIFPYWVLGMVLGSAVSVFLKDRIHNLMRSLGDKKLGILGVIPASILGLASPLCMYGTIPIAASFSRSGIQDDWLAAFMMSSVLLNPQLLIYSVAGLLVRLFYQNKPFFNFSGFEEPKSRDTEPNVLLRFLKNLGRNVKATGLYFLFGMVLSALFQRYVPAQAMTALFGGSEAFGVLMAATIGVPLYACGGGTIPLLQQWLWNGMSLGGAAAFMITGPATKITNLGALKIVLGMKRFLLYIGYTLIFALLTGLLVNMII